MEQVHIAMDQEVRVRLLTAFVIQNAAESRHDGGRKNRDSKKKKSCETARSFPLRLSTLTRRGKALQDRPWRGTLKVLNNIYICRLTRRRLTLT
jgi:hypothetical protein